MQSLKIVAFSDYRVQDIDLLQDFIQNMNSEPDIILYGGDDISRFVEYKRVRSRTEPSVSRIKITRNKFSEIAILSKFGLCAIIGNDEKPQARDFIRGRKVRNIHEKPFVCKNYRIVGIEGAIHDPEDESIGIGHVFYTEETLKEHLECLKRDANGKKTIILSHSPPRDILDTAQRSGLGNIGSRSLRDFIQTNHDMIPLVVCGHVHLQGGRSATCGKTIIVNVASHDMKGSPGRVAIIEIQADDVTVSHHEIYGVYGVDGIGLTRHDRLKEAGITTVDQLAKVGAGRLRRILKCSIATADKISVSADAILEKKIIYTGRLPHIKSNCLFLDIETDLRHKLVWMIGMYFEETNRLIQLAAHEPAEEECILKQFLETTRNFKGKIYIYSGMKFDEVVLKKRLKFYGMDCSSLPMFVDLKTHIKRAFVLPLTSYKLKVLADYFDYKYTHTNLGGAHVAIEYLHQYQKTKDKDLMKKFLEYNEDDVRVLPWIVKKLQNLRSQIDCQSSLDSYFTGR